MIYVVYNTLTEQMYLAHQQSFNHTIEDRFGFYVTTLPYGRWSDDWLNLGVL